MLNTIRYLDVQAWWTLEQGVAWPQQVDATLQHARKTGKVPVTNTVVSEIVVSKHNRE